MNRFLFFSLAKHQTLYFQRLLDENKLSGRVVTSQQLPIPSLHGVRRILSDIDWGRLVDEKCRERVVKKKYNGFLYRLLLRLEILLVALRVQTLVDRERPDVVVVWNGANRYCQVLLCLVPQGTRTFFVENGLLPNTTTIDARGVNYHNSVPRNAAFYRSYAEGKDIEAEKDVALIPRKPRVADQEVVSLPESFIFIPFQDDRDTQVRLFSPWIRDMRDLFALGEKIVRETGMTVVFKEHPSSRESYSDLHERTHERLRFANGNPTQELIEKSLFVVTLNSTVGLESLLLGKPLLTLGQAFFNIEGVVMHADSSNEAVEVVKRFPDWPLEDSLRLGFLHFLRNEYCVPGRWQDSSPEHLREVARRMQA